ncbi:MAG: attA2 [Verrucomicrobiales bacterium]|nr:attA2 [Verrucomicrobiales bacterium]
MSVLLSVKNLSFHYGKDAIPLTDVSFDVEAGFGVGLFGPNGSGKSSLLNILGGHLAAIRGSISINGIDVTQTPADLRPTATVFQDLGLFPHLSCEGNVEIAAKKKGRTGVRSDGNSVKAIIDSLKLEGQGRKMPGEMSGGMQQRCAIARSLACGPKVLLMDEPTASLDIDAKRRLSRLIRQLQRDNGEVAIVVVSHDLPFLMETCSNLLILDGGCVVTHGRVDDLFYRPPSIRAAELLGVENIISRKFSLGEPDGGRLGFRSLHSKASLTRSHGSDEICFEGKCLEVFSSPPRKLITISLAPGIEIEATWPVETEPAHRGTHVFASVPKSRVIEFPI